MAGISRIDQLEKRTHGWFVRLARKGKIYPAFLADKSNGGKRRALKAAQKHYQKLVREHGRISRRELEQMARRKSSSGIVGVRKVTVTTTYWVAHWSPRPNVRRKKAFSIKVFGAEKARALAVAARIKGLKKMVKWRTGGA
jgi:hypothetical protein